MKNHATISRTRRRHAAAVLTASLALSGAAFGLAAPTAYATPEGSTTGTAWTSAYASPEGGWGNPIEHGNIHLGGYVIENGPFKGTVAWCPQLGKPNPLNDQTPRVDVTTIRNGSGQTVSGLNLAKLNYLIATKGQKIESPSYDAAVALAVWYYSGDIDRNGIAAPGIAGYAGQNMLTNDSIPAQYQGDVRAFFDRFIAETDAAVTSAPTNIAEPATPVLELAGDGLAATITVPEGNGTVSLAGAVTADTGAASITQPGTCELTPVRPDDTTSRWDVSFASSGHIDEHGRVARVTLHAESSGQQQTIISAAGAARDWSHKGSVTVDQSVVIEGDSKTPTKLVKPGEKYQDEITLHTVDGKPWPTFTQGERAGEPMPVPVQMSRYESAAERVEGEIPEGATPVEEFTFVAPGPGTYTVGDTVAEQGGTHSNWVMTIDTTNTDVWTEEYAPLKAFLPDGYTWQHTYGLERESQVTPMSVTVATELTKDTLSADGDSVADVQTVTSVGAPWLTVDGEPIPVAWKNEVYFVPDVTKDELTQSPEVPADAELIDTYETIISSEEPQETEAFNTPKGKVGAITVRACVDPTAMDERVRDLVEPHCEDFGVPTQSASIVKEHQALATTGGDNGSLLIWASIGGTGALLGGLMLMKRKRGENPTA